MESKGLEPFTSSMPWKRSPYDELRPHKIINQWLNFSICPLIGHCFLYNQEIFPCWMFQTVTSETKQITFLKFFFENWPGLICCPAYLKILLFRISMMKTENSVIVFGGFHSTVLAFTSKKLDCYHFISNSSYFRITWVTSGPAFSLDILCWSSTKLTFHTLLWTVEPLMFYQLS